VRWPWPRAQAGPVEPRRASVSSNSNVKALELQAAMEILAEVFGTRPGEVEEMIQRRLERISSLRIFAACFYPSYVAEHP